MSSIFSNLVGLCFSIAWIFAIVVIIKRVSNNNGNRNQDPSGRPGGNTGAQSGMPMGMNPSSRMQMPQSGMQQPYGRNVYGNTHPPMQGNMRGAGSGAPAGATYRAGSTYNTGNVIDMDGDGKISTVEYLAQKAREDEAEHLRDEYLTKQKLTQGGALRLGQQIPDDGMLPRGSRLVYCGYCGAENVIPHMTDQRAFHCYFCHEQL